MKIAIMQPYLFPYIGYWQLINAVDTFVIYDDVTFIKQGYINRNNILSNNEIQSFTLELIGASSNKLINEISIGNNRKKILKTLELNYKKAKYFDDVFPIIVDILGSNEKELVKVISYSLVKISEYLKIDTQLIYSSNLKKNNNLKGQEKVLDIIKLLNGKEYINPIGGMELYNKGVFGRENIQLYFLKSSPIEYQQFKNKFVPNLSIIDIMMFNSIDEIKEMLKRYQLV